MLPTVHHLVNRQPARDDERRAFSRPPRSAQRRGPEKRNGQAGILPPATIACELLSTSERRIESMKSVLLTLAFIICASVIVGAASAQDAPLGRDPASRRAERRVSIPTHRRLTSYGAAAPVETRTLRRSSACSLSRPSAGSNSMVTMAMDFERGINPAGDRGEGLKPGQCAWVDRGYGGLEPITIRFETSSNAQLAQTRHGSEVDRSPTAAERYPDKQTIPVYLSDSNCFWVFRAYTTNQGYLQAVSHQHWKPSVSILDRIVGGSPRSRPPTRRGSSSGDGGRFPPGGTRRYFHPAAPERSL